MKRMISTSAWALLCVALLSAPMTQSHAQGTTVSAEPESELRAELHADVPIADVEPGALGVAQETGKVATRMLLVGNDGPAPLEFEIGDWRVQDTYAENRVLWAYGQDAYRDESNGHVVLTEAKRDRVGTLWLKAQVTKPFVVKFRYRAGGGTGSDGLVLMFYKDTDYEPGDGGCLGFGPEGVPNCVSRGYGIEIDSYKDSWDSTDNHIALIKDSMANHLALVNTPHVDDNVWHRVRVEVDPESVLVALDGVEQFKWEGVLDAAYGGLGFGGATGGRTNWHLVDDVSLTVGEGQPHWLSVEPISGTVSAYDSEPVQLAFYAKDLQPDTYAGELLVLSNDPFTPTASVAVTMTVHPTDGMGWAEGAVTDTRTEESLKASIAAVGQPYTVTTDATTGCYRIWLEEGAYSLVASGSGYVTGTAVVNITAGQGTTLDFALVLDVPVIEVSPHRFDVTQDMGDRTRHTLTISNTGPAALDFEVATGHPSEPVLLLHFDESAGSTAFDDMSGYGNDASCASEACPTAGVEGRYRSALEFDGSTDYLSIPDSPSLRPRQEMAISVWIYPRAWNGNNRIVTKGTSDNENRLLNSRGKLQFRLTGIGALDAALPATGMWHHVLGQFDGTIMQIWVDGQLVTELPSTGEISHTLDPLLIGTCPGCRTEDRFSGRIDEVVIFKRALSPQMVRDLYNGEGCEQASWLDFDPVSGQVSPNSSVHGQAMLDGSGLLPDIYTTKLLVLSNDPACPVVSIPVTMTVLPRFLGVGKSDYIDPLHAGMKQRYTITISNPLASGVTNVVVSDTLPSMTYPLLDESTPGGVFDEESRTVAWEIPELGSGQSVLLELCLGTYPTIGEGIVLTNTVWLYGSETIPVTATERTAMLAAIPTTTAVASPTSTCTPPLTVTPTNTPESTVTATATEVASPSPSPTLSETPTPTGTTRPHAVWLALIVRP